MPSQRRTVRAAVVVLACCAPATPAIAQTFGWNNSTGGTYSVAGNWTPAGPPTLASHTAVFNLPNAYTVTLTASANHGTLLVSGGTVTFAGAQAYNVATMNVGSSELNLASGINLAASGVTTIAAGGTLNIPTGTTFSTTQNLVVNGGAISRTGSSTSMNIGDTRALIIQGGGTVSITGGSAFWSLANRGISVTNGLFSIAGFLDLGGASGTGTLVLNGSPARASVGGESFWGVSGGFGDVSVLNGGVGTFGHIRLGATNSTGSNGRLQVTNGSVTLNSLSVGSFAAASGSVVLSAGGVLEVTSGPVIVGSGTTAGVNGTININNGIFHSSPVSSVIVTQRGVINVGSLGGLNLRHDLNINGGTLDTTLGNVILAASRFTTVDNGGNLLGAAINVNAAHTLNVSSGARMQLTGTLQLGTVGGGTLTINGAGSRLIASGMSRVGSTTSSGFLSLDNSATAVFDNGLNLISGTLQIANSASMSVFSAPLNVGTTATAGAVQVNGGTLLISSGLDVRAGSRVDVTSGMLSVSGSAFSMTGGTLTTSSTGTILLSNGLFTTLESGARWDSALPIDVPNFGQLGVFSGSVVSITGSSPVLRVGAGVPGSMQVSGPGSSVSVGPTGSASWGTSAGSAQVTFSSGAVGTFGTIFTGTSSGQATIGIFSGAKLIASSVSAGSTVGAATFNIDGAGSELNIGQLTTTAGAMFKIGNGATMQVGTATLAGIVNINGGTVNLGVLQSIVQPVNLSHGALLYTGSLSTASGVLGANPNIGPQQRVTVNGNAVLQSFSTLSLTGGELRVNAITGSGGSFHFDSGTLNLGGGLTLGPAGPLGSQLDLTTGKALVSPGITIEPGAVLRQAGGLLGYSSTLLVEGTYLFEGGTVQTSTGSIDVGNAGALIVSANRTLAAAGAIRNAGVVELGGGAARIGGSGSLLNLASGLIGGEGILDRSVVNAGEIRAASGKTLRFNGGFAAQTGRITLFGGGIDVPVGFTNSGTISGRGAINAGTGMTNGGTVQLSAGFSDITGAVTNASASKLIVSGGAVASFYSPVNNLSGSELRISTGSTAVFFGNVSGLAQITGTGTAVFEASTSPGTLINGGRSVVGPVGSLEATVIRQVGLNVEGGARVVPGVTPTVSRLNEMTLAGSPGAWTGTLDLENNALIVDYTGASPLAAVTDQLRQGFALGGWTGSGIRSGVARITGNRAIGMAEAVDLGASTFLGDPVDSTALLLRFTLPGDANLDAVVSIADFALLASNFNQSGYWARGDFNYDGTIGIGDFALLASNFNLALPVDSARGRVPEPTGGALLMLAVLGARRRARR